MVSDQLLFVLKIALLILLYLFFFRVVRAVWAELRPTGQRPQPVPTAPAHSASRRSRRENQRPQFVVLEPAELFGTVFPLDSEASIGRAAGCQITLDDTYSSQIHARVFARDGAWQVEDLGSTNGTWLNRQKVAGPMIIKPGDHLQIGNTIMELQ